MKKAVGIIEVEKQTEEWKPKFGEKVLAWDDDGDFEDVYYLGTSNDYYGFLCSHESVGISFTLNTEIFDNVKPLPTKTKVTLKEIAEWKGVRKEDIEIV